MESEEKKKRKASGLLHRFKVTQAIAVAVMSTLLSGGCGSEKAGQNPDEISEGNQTVETVSDTAATLESKEMENSTEMGANPESIFENIEIQKSAKAITDHNPVMVQRFGADPYALVYNGRVYIYMTGDKPSYNADGSAKENTYGNINTINVVSSDDLVNWTDHGTIYAAGNNGAASWGPNSWAPAAAYKNIDGKDKFFLYFANNGNGIGVLSSDSPVGPFVDELGHPLISRETPNCAEVTWLFDPAVLMDDDGSAYIYVGGGVPSPDKAANPGTARVCKLGDDMMSLDGNPIPIENVDYLFEDSGINKIDGIYYYSYCSNFSMTPEATKELGFENGEIVCMKSDNPMGPFERCNPVLKNPEKFFGRGGNNHHAMFEFEGQYYITYHSRILEEGLGMDGGYRSTNVNQLILNDNNEPSASVGTRGGVSQLRLVDPYKEVKAVTLANASMGIKTKQYGEVAKECGSGDMILAGIADGEWTSVAGVDFGETGAKEISFTIDVKETAAGSDVRGAIKICLDSPSGAAVGYAVVPNEKADGLEVVAQLPEAVTGQHSIFFIYAGEKYEVYSWIAR